MNVFITTLKLSLETTNPRPVRLFQVTDTCLYYCFYHCGFFWRELCIERKCHHCHKSANSNIYIVWSFLEEVHSNCNLWSYTVICTKRKLFLKQFSRSKLCKIIPYCKGMPNSTTKSKLNQGHCEEMRSVQKLWVTDLLVIYSTNR